MLYSRLFFLHAGCSIDADDFAVNPFAVLGGEEADNTGDVNWLTDTVHGGPSFGVLSQVSHCSESNLNLHVIFNLPHRLGRRTACRHLECTHGTRRGTCPS